MGDLCDRASQHRRTRCTRSARRAVFARGTQRARLDSSDRAIRELLVGSEQMDAAFARLCAPETQIVTLTVTEKGYCLDAQGKLQMSHPDIQRDLQSPSHSSQHIGWLVEALRRRRAQGDAPFIVISCDNLMDNGRALHRALIDYAQALEPPLARFIESEVICPLTMVDKHHAGN